MNTAELNATELNGEAGPEPIWAYADALTLLGAPSAYGFSDWQGAVDLSATVKYLCALQSEGFDPVILPISSWQATIQAGRQSYLQVVVPSAADLINSITERSGGSIVVTSVNESASGGVVSSEIARAPLGQIAFQRGPFRATATLSGYSDLGFALSGSGVAQGSTRVLRGIRSITAGGARRARADIDFALRPGMEVIASTQQFIASYINFYATKGESYMDVGEVLQ